MPGPLQLRHWPWLVATLTVLLFATAWVTTPLVVARNFQGRLDGGEFDRMDEMLSPDGRWLVLVLKPGDLQIEPRSAMDWLCGRCRFREYLVDRTHVRLSVQRGTMICSRNYVYPVGQAISGVNFDGPPLSTAPMAG